MRQDRNITDWKAAGSRTWISSSLTEVGAMRKLILLLLFLLAHGAAAAGIPPSPPPAPLSSAVPGVSIGRTVYWGAAGVSPDGTQCAAPAEITINSGPKQYAIVCADNDGSTLWGHVMLPDGYTGGSTFVFALDAVQTAAATDTMNSDISCECRGNGDTVNNTLGSEVAIDGAMQGSSIVDVETSGPVTCNGSCAAGDNLFWRWQIDAAGSTGTAWATYYVLGMRMEFTGSVGD